MKNRGGKFEVYEWRKDESMKLDRGKISRDKLGFFFICLGLLCGVLFMTKIFDLNIETTEVQAVVTNTFKGSGRNSSRRPKMNVEWVDLNGEVQTEGSLWNRFGLEEGDYYTIIVDAETQSRMVLTPAGSITMFVLGLLCNIICIVIMRVFYCCSKGEKSIGNMV